MINSHCLVTICLLLAHAVSFGQVVLRNIVVDGESRRGLPFVSVAVKNTQWGTVTDENGRFTVTVRDVDSLLITSVGYETLLIAVSSAADTIRMQQKVVSLSEITFSASRLKKRTRLGNVLGKSRIAIGGMHQITYRIDQSPGYYGGEVEVLYFYFQASIDKEKLATTRVRLRVYENQDGRPGEDLLLQDVIVDLDSKQRDLAYDISQFRVKVPDEGIFVGLDFLGTIDGNGKFVPYDKLYRPVNLRIDCTETAISHTLQKSFGTDWYRTSLPTRDGKVKLIDAKIGVRIVY